MRKFGLIGSSLQHSFSPTYFKEKFQRENITDASYEAFELSRINEIQDLLKEKNLVGLNVTFPFKEQVMPFLHEISPEAQVIGAVNTVQIVKGKTIGYNTDFLGFEQSLISFLDGSPNRALVLGTGGASKAVCFCLHRLGISYQLVSRRQVEGSISYDQMISEMIFPQSLIINCTPVGTYPKVDQKPPIPYRFLKPSHMLFDLVYNPEESAFLKEGKKVGCKVKNGYEMLVNQAEASWDIWND